MQFYILQFLFLLISITAYSEDSEEKLAEFQKDAILFERIWQIDKPEYSTDLLVSIPNTDNFIIFDEDEGYNKYKFRIISYANNNIVKEFPPKCTNDILRPFCPEISKNGKTMVSLHRRDDNPNKGNFKVWSIERGELIKELTIPDNHEVSDFAISLSGRYVISCSANTGSLILFDIYSEINPIRNFIWPDDYISHVSFSPDEKLIGAVSDRGNSAKVWDIKNGISIKEFKISKESSNTEETSSWYNALRNLNK